MKSNRWLEIILILLEKADGEKGGTGGSYLQNQGTGPFLGG